MEKKLLLTLFFSLFISLFLINSMNIVSAVNVMTTDNSAYTSITSNSNATITLYNQSYVKLNGINGLINITDSNLTSPNTTGQLTVSFWINISNHNFTGLSEGYVNYLNKNQFGPVNAEWLFRMYNRTSIDNRTCRMSFYVFNITGSIGIGSYFQDNSTQYGCAELENRWIFVTGVLNGTHSQIWRDGVLRDADSYAGQIYPINGNSSVKIGSDLQNSYMNASFDELRIYNRSLNVTEIGQINASGRYYNSTLITTGLVGHWSFDEATGTIVYDKTNNSNNGTIINGVTWTNDGINVTKFLQIPSVNVLSNLIQQPLIYIYSYLVNQLIPNTTYILLNNSAINTSYDLQIQNISNALIYFNNLSVAGSSTISNNDNPINITLRPTSFLAFSEDFTRYNNGNNTMRPTWIPQYNGLVNVTTNKKMLVTAFTPFGGDRDIHVTLNRSDIMNENIRNFNISFNYNITQCNQTWKGSEGVTQQGASVYMFYNSSTANDFIDAELKMFSNNSLCSNGTAQLSMFKRTNSTSTALIPFTTFYQDLNRTFNVLITFNPFNSTNYNYSVFLNGTILGSSNNITTQEIKGDQFLLESAGTNTIFDDVNIYLANQSTYTYILDEFNLTEGMNRSFSPLWFSTSSTTEKHIASNLSQTITATIIVTLDPAQTCADITSISYTPDGGALISPSYSCSDVTDKITFTSLQINPAVNSNVLLISYDVVSTSTDDSCSATTIAFLSFPALIGLIGTVFLIGLVIMIIMGYSNENANIFSQENVIFGILSVIVMGMLVIVGIAIIGAVCAL